MLTINRRRFYISSILSGQFYTNYKQASEMSEPVKNKTGGFTMYCKKLKQHVLNVSKKVLKEDKSIISILTESGLTDKKCFYENQCLFCKDTKNDGIGKCIQYYLCNFKENFENEIFAESELHHLINGIQLSCYLDAHLSDILHMAKSFKSLFFYNSLISRIGVAMYCPEGFDNGMQLAINPSIFCKEFSNYGETSTPIKFGKKLIKLIGVTKTRMRFGNSYGTWYLIPREYFSFKSYECLLFET